MTSKEANVAMAASDSALRTPGGGRSPRGTPTWRGLQIALGAVWLLDGVLQFQPWMFTRSFVAQVLFPSAQGQPAWVAGPTTSIAHFVAPHIAAWNACFATIQLAIGLGIVAGVLSSRTWMLKLAIVGSFAWSILVWWLSEGLGGVLTGASPISGAPGAVVLYAVVGVLVWPRTSGDHSEEERAVQYGLVGDVGARVIWAVLWVFSAMLLLEPVNQQPGAVRSAIMGGASGEPAWLHGALVPVADLFKSAGSLVDFVVAAAMAVIGLGVAFAWHPRFLLGCAVVLALAIWILGQGLGGVLTGHGTDPNTGPLWVLLAGCLWRRLGDDRVAASPCVLPVLGSATEGER